MTPSLRMALRLGGWIVLAGAIVVAAGWLVVAAGPRLVGWQSAVVLSGSMEPALNVGDIAFVELTSNPGAVRPGDIITFRSPDDHSRRVSHRVVEVVNDGNGLSFRTKGDSNELPDQQLIPAENLVGKVRFHLPYLGYVGDWLRGRDGFLLFVGIPGILIITGELRNIAREVARARRLRLVSRAGGGEES
ncbi:MAG: signal peptidase I [Dehalococcoidia bacterium]|nr:signal peptidase I [Dehalococcoidia bacterium]